MYSIFANSKGSESVHLQPKGILERERERERESLADRVFLGPSF